MDYQSLVSKAIMLYMGVQTTSVPKAVRMRIYWGPEGLFGMVLGGFGGGLEMKLHWSSMVVAVMVGWWAWFGGCVGYMSRLGKQQE